MNLRGAKQALSAILARPWDEISTRHNAMLAQSDVLQAEKELNQAISVISEEIERQAKNGRDGKRLVMVLSYILEELQ